MINTTITVTKLQNNLITNQIFKIIPKILSSLKDTLFQAEVMTDLPSAAVIRIAKTKGFIH